DRLHRPARGMGAVVVPGGPLQVHYEATQDTSGTIEHVIELDQRGILFVTGTGTGVGKTVVTAAIAALAAADGQRVAVVKVAQTGIHDGPGSDTPDLETITRLSGVTDTHELARFPDP